MSENIFRAVYVLVSSKKDYFLEELYLSTYSLKVYNPNVQIVVITDDNTYNNLDNDRRQLLEYVDEVIVKKFENNISSKEKSRMLKTSFRNELQGDLLFLDTDTIICDNLSELTNINCDISMVLEGNDIITNFYSAKDLEITLDKFDLEMGINNHYFNSGVIYVKDKQKTRNFFSEWNNLYRIYYKKGLTFDQGTLNHLNNQYKGYISLLPNIYNCQCDLGLKYLSNAKIIHYLGLNTNTDKGQLFFSFSSFSNKNIYEEIKRTCSLNDEIKEMIKRPNIQIKNGFFVSDDTIIYNLLFSKQFKFLRYLLSRHNRLYTIIENVMGRFM